MKNPLRSGIAALIAIAFSASPAWAARSQGARLTIADNKVSVAGLPVSAGTTIAAGDTITTGSRSHAELTLPDGTVARIGQGSSFTYTGAKLVLNQGTALIHATRKGTTVVSGSRTYTGGPAVVSAEVSKKTDGLYILQGGGKVNGVTLIPGQSSVLDHGRDRTFTFDLQKMEASSALVTKFPQTPWVVQTEALALVQHQLLTAKVTPAGKSRPQAAQDAVSGGLASLGNAGSAAGRSGNVASPGGGALQLLGGPLSLGADKVAVIKSAVISTVTNGGRLTISGAVTVTSASAVQASLVKAGVGTLNLNGGTLNLGTSRSGGNSTLSGTITATAVNVANFTLNTGISAGALTVGNTTTIANGSGAVLNTGAGVLNLTGANTFTGATNVNAGTLVVGSGGTISNLAAVNVASGSPLIFTSPVLTLDAGTFLVNGGKAIPNLGGLGSLASGGAIVFPTGSSVVVAGTTLPQQAGQTVTINGVTYTTAPGSTAGTLTLQRAAQ